MKKINLQKLDTLSDGTRRFQSQLRVGRDTADFIMGNDNIMKCYGYGKNGFDFYEYKKSYKII